MMTRFPLFPRLQPLAFVALAACPACGIEPAPLAAGSPSAVEAVVRPQKPPASSVGRAAAKRPDPRYRPPAGLSELKAIAGEVARASGRKIGWRLQTGANPGPLVRIRGNVDDCTIYVHPVAARKVPPNTWAFLFGHEFAHMTENLGVHSATSPANELKADIVGARYAMAAGYRIEAFLGWVLTEPNTQTSSHGSLHRRVKDIAAHFRIPQATIQEQARRASRYRATH